jgi:hypothetical protein
VRVLTDRSAAARLQIKILHLIVIHSPRTTFLEHDVATHGDSFGGGTAAMDNWPSGFWPTGPKLG